MSQAKKNFSEKFASSAPRLRADAFARRPGLALTNEDQYIIRQLERHTRKRPGEGLDAEGLYHIAVDHIPAEGGYPPVVSFTSYQRFMERMRRFGLIDEMAAEKRVYKRHAAKGTDIIAVATMPEINKLYDAHNESLGFETPKRASQTEEA